MSEEDRLRDDFRRFSYECPNCGEALSEYAEKCPHCGQNLFEVFSGTFRPKRSRALRIIALLVLIAFLAVIIVTLVMSLRTPP